MIRAFIQGDNDVRFLLLAAFAALALGPTPVSAQPVQYVRYCDAFGENFFYSPGTDTCVNAITGAPLQFPG